MKEVDFLQYYLGLCFSVRINGKSQIDKPQFDCPAGEFSATFSAQTITFFYVQSKLNNY